MTSRPFKVSISARGQPGFTARDQRVRSVMGQMDEETSLLISSHIGHVTQYIMVISESKCHWVYLDQTYMS